jgi:hypothetical protein
MKILRIFLLYVSFVFALFVISSNTYAANVNFNGNQVGLVEVRTSVWGSYLIITILNSSGARIKLCDAAPDPWAMALSITNDPTAKNVQALALSAKLAGKPVQGWGLDQVQGSWCGIGNFSIP